MKKISLLVATVLIVFAVLIFFVSGSKAGELDSFALCLKDKGAVLYGSFWCPICRSQKKLFGASDKLLNYVECSTPNGQDQAQICKDKHIEVYPTWEFANGASASGELSLKDLSDRTGCPLPK